MLINEAFLTKLDEEPMIEIVNRMETVYIDEPDPFMLEFPAAKFPEMETDTFPIQQDYLSKVKTLYKKLTYSLGYSPQMYPCFNEHPEVTMKLLLILKNKVLVRFNLGSSERERYHTSRI